MHLLPHIICFVQASDYHRSMSSVECQQQQSIILAPTRLQQSTAEASNHHPQQQAGVYKGKPLLHPEQKTMLP